MTIRAALVAVLEADVTVTALVSTRIGPPPLSEDSQYPAVTVQIIGTRREVASGADPGIARRLVDVNSWGRTLAEAEGVAEVVRQSLERYRGTVSSVQIDDIYVENEQDFFESEAGPERRGLHRVLQEFEVVHRETP